MFARAEAEVADGASELSRTFKPLKLQCFGRFFQALKGI